MKFQFEGLDEIVEINFNFKNSNLIQALDPDESIPILIPEKFPKHHIMMFKELLEIMETKPELSDDEKHLGLSFIMTPLIDYFSFDREFKNRFKIKKATKSFDVFIEIYNEDPYMFKYGIINGEKIGSCSSLEEVSIIINRHIIRKSNYLFENFVDFRETDFRLNLDLDEKIINLNLGRNWKCDFSFLNELEDKQDLCFNTKQRVLSFDYYNHEHLFNRKINFLIQESELDDLEIIKSHPECPYNFKIKTS